MAKQLANAVQDCTNEAKEFDVTSMIQDILDGISTESDVAKKFCRLNKLANMIPDGNYEFVLKSSDATIKGVTTHVSAAELYVYLSDANQIVAGMKYRAEKELDDKIAVLRWSNSINQLSLSNIINNSEIDPAAILEAKTKVMLAVTKAGMQQKILNMSKDIKALGKNPDRNAVAALRKPIMDELKKFTEEIPGCEELSVILETKVRKDSNGNLLVTPYGDVSYTVAFTSAERIRSKAAYDAKNYQKRHEMILKDNNLDEDAKLASTQMLINELAGTTVVPQFVPEDAE